MADFVEPLGMRILIRKDESRQQTKGGIIHPAPFLIIGLVLSRIGWPMDNRIAHRFLDLLGYDEATRQTVFFFHSRFGEALLLIGLLVCFDKWVKIKTTWFENTQNLYQHHIRSIGNR